MKESIDKDYWEEYYKFWDDFVGRWFNQRKQGFKTPQDKDKDSKAFCHAVKGLVLDELPNPYFGDPKNGVDAVIINLNPGGSEKDKDKKSTDATQFYNNLNDPDKDRGKGWLMWKFVDAAKCSYKRFVGNDSENVNWSQLNPDLRWHKPEVCGIKWWQGLLKEGENGDEDYDGKPRKIIHSSKKRIEWMRRIYNNPWLNPARVFALELCPFHSEQFIPDVLKEDMELLRIIQKRVLEPAVFAASQISPLPFALAVGKPIADVIDILIGRKVINAKEEMTISFENYQLITGFNEDDWPKSWQGKGASRMQLPKKRSYKLYSIKTQSGTESMILVTWADGTFYAPSEEFAPIEDFIVRSATTNRF